MDPFLIRDVLPAACRPVHYDLQLTPNLTSFKFQGSVQIHLEIKEATNRISVNAAELELGLVELSYQGQKYPATKINWNKEKEQVEFEFACQLQKDQSAILHVDFVGIHNDKMAGFYRSGYTDTVTKEKKWMVVTQFEATDARKAFPCWDEPAVKATFDVTLVVPQQLTALSNMNEISTTPLEGGLKRVKFAKTPIMSTYLLAFVVGDLSYIESVTKDAQKTVVRVYAPTGQEKQGEFGLDVAVRTLEFFTDYFDIAYPLPKMDLVAIPDFSAGAMENWGLVTYRTVYLLFDEKVSAARSKQNVAYVVGHELAHQWFGNLVTMDWWSDLWLNEGFATWVGWLAVDHLFPEWKVWTGFVNDDYQRGLNLDAMRSSHPIEVPVKNPHEIHQIFDAISYSKGACVIRMLVNYLGEEAFRNGIRSYLKKFKYRNAKTTDLWEALEGASKGKPVAQLMESWTRQMGYPIVSVSEENVNGSLTLNVRQERFLSSGDVKPDEDVATWFVPLQIITSNTLTQPTSDMLPSKTGKFPIKDLSGSLKASEFYKLNYGHTGFYRTNYNAAILKKLGVAIQNGMLDTTDRIGLLTDVFAMAQAGYTSVVDALVLLDSYSGETDYMVWSEIAAQLTQLQSVWWEEPTEVTDKLKAISRRLFGPLAKKLGWEYAPQDPQLTVLLRTLAISSAGRAEDNEVVAEAQRRFALFMAGDEKAVHPNLRGAVFSIVLRHGGVKEFDHILKLYRETTIADQKMITLSSLGAVRDLDLLKRHLDFSITDEVRPQDIIYVIGPVASNPIGRRLAWDFVKEKWQVFYDRYYHGGMSLLGRIVSSSCGDFASTKWLKEVEAFFGPKDLSAIDRSIQQSMERIKTHAAWLDRDRAAVAKYLKEKQ